MNILFLAPEFLPVWGGVGTYISELAKKLPNDMNIYVLTPKRVQFGTNEKKPFENNNLIDIFPDNVKVHYVGVARDTFFYNLRFQLSCLKHVKTLKKKFDIDLIHSTSALPDLLIDTKSVEVPIITTIHTTIQNQVNILKKEKMNYSSLEKSELLTYLFSPALIHLENRYYAQNRSYITVSNWAKKSIVETKKIDSKRVRVIHNGIDCKIFNPANKIQAKTIFPELADIEDIKILFLSRMIESKGISYYLDAIPKILENVDAHFIFAGPGLSVDDRIKQKNISYLGYVPHEATPFLYASSDIFILPSLSENFPFSILEAMATQLPVIASDVGGIPEMIIDGYNGKLIPPRNSSLIIDNLTQVIEDSDMRKYLGSNARKSVMENFTWDRSVNRTKEYYEEVISGENLFN